MRAFEKAGIYNQNPVHAYCRPRRVYVWTWRVYSSLHVHPSSVHGASGEERIPDIWIHNRQGLCTHCSECPGTPSWGVHGRKSGGGNL
ncbi:hypothetical protein GBAR_LOCUS25190 [Geodia barretti]|uniref:Uncharacterized protein n=1 Tax=Geodia barretti TaxID=519541 RepID=A0AA35TDF3_GEOBA|nr:hypothetical protein GBAR_LOCUS25190 [Geodia barretti]